MTEPLNNFRGYLGMKENTWILIITKMKMSMMNTKLSVMRITMEYSYEVGLKRKYKGKEE